MKLSLPIILFGLWNFGLIKELEAQFSDDTSLEETVNEYLPGFTDKFDLTSLDSTSQLLINTRANPVILKH